MSRKSAEEKKKAFDLLWSGKIDDRLVDYKLPIKTKQTFICICLDDVHEKSSNYVQEYDGVTFTTSLYRLYRNVNCCPICIANYAKLPPTNKFSEDEIKEKIANYEKNPTVNGKQTILISPFKAVTEQHVFQCSCQKLFNRVIGDALKPDRWLLCLDCTKKRCKQDDRIEKKILFGEKWNNIISDKLIDYTKNVKEPQKFICLVEDHEHSLSELFDEKEQHVIFNLSLSQVLNNINNCCPVCIEETRHQEPYNKLTESEIIEKIKNHPNNEVNEHKKQTILISKYIGTQNIHEFECSCGIIFKRRLTDMFRNNRTFKCNNCTVAGSSRSSLKWLDTLNIPGLRTYANGGEFTIPGTRYRADGYDPETRTVYEFHGCEFHGHYFIKPTCRLTKNKGSFSYYGETYMDLYDRTESRKLQIIKLGYNYVEKWECEFD